jgi:hypothetical protein
MKTFGFVLLGILAILAGLVISSAFFGFLGMLAVGILFAEGVLPSTISFASALWLGLIYSILVSVLAAGAVNN